MFAMWCYRRMNVGPNVLHASGAEEACEAKALKARATGGIESLADTS
jgi:hypothetical protein